MSDQMAPDLRNWLQDTAAEPACPSQSTDEVMTRTANAGQRGQWWPWPAVLTPAPMHVPATSEPASARGSTLFSALKFVAASVIVALFGGFLLVGVLTTQPSDGVLPAAVTESPEPAATTTTTEPNEPIVRTDLLPGVELTVEEAEPGVFRIVSDGVRDQIPGAWGITVGLDGSIWGQTDEGFLRLGSEFEPDQFGDLLGVTPDGVIWTSEYEPPGWGDDVVVIRTYDGEEWTVRHQLHPDFGFEITPDGTVWTWWPDPEAQGWMIVARHGPDGWEQLGEPLEGEIGGLLVREDGDIWATHEDGLSAYRDGAWQQVFTKPAWTEPLGADAWIRTAPRLPEGEGPASATDAGTWPLDDYSLMAWDGGGWRAFGPDDILLELGEEVQVDVSPDGSLWASHEVVADGVRRYDGERWHRYLPGRNVHSTSFGPDGSRWVLTGEARYDGEAWIDSGDLYVVTPDAVGIIEESGSTTAAVETQALDILPGVDLVAEEVQTGIYRVIDDGVRSLSPLLHRAGWLSDIRGSVEAGHDGGIYIMVEGGFYRLGDDEIHPWPVEAPEAVSMEVAPNGTVWARTAGAGEGELGTLHSFDGDTWTTYGGELGDLDVSPSGTVWVTLVDPDQQAWVLRHTGDEGASWQTLEIPLPSEEIPGWDHPRLAVADDSHILVGAWGLGSWRYTDGAWQQVDYGLQPETNPDGTFWTVAWDEENGGLYRHDESGTRQWTLTELGLSPMGGWFGVEYLVAPDGSLWASRWESAHVCTGVLRFDGLNTQCHLLPGRPGIDGIDIAPDGSVWVAAEHDLYVITPEAVAVAEERRARVSKGWGDRQPPRHGDRS